MLPPRGLAARAADRAKSLKARDERTKSAAKKTAAVKVERRIRVAPVVEKPALVVTPPVDTTRTGIANVPLYRYDEACPSAPSRGLSQLVNLYLHAAEHRSRHIALVWPACPRTLVLVHALATLERWAVGDKLGMRGAVYPVKSNVFHPLNDLHLDRMAVLRHANDLIESGPNARVKRGLQPKDAYLYSLNSLSPEERESFNPTVGELLPHFLAGPDFTAWQSCENHLLAHIRAKLTRRAHGRALQGNRSVIGSPSTAPDALFALDGRLTDAELKKALAGLRKVGQPEVIIVIATRQIRLKAKGWRNKLARFCLLVETAFPSNTPGVVVVTDEPNAAYRLKDELWEQNGKRLKDERWQRPDEYAIVGFPCGVKQDGLLVPGAVEARAPSPRELDTQIVDAEAAKVINRLFRIAALAPGGRESAKAVLDAAGYLGRLAAMPCGVAHLLQWLSGADIEDRQRANFSWSAYYGALVQFDKGGGAGEQRRVLLECMAQATHLYENYRDATPFALLLANYVGSVAQSTKRDLVLVFTSALYLRMAETFLTGYAHFPEGMRYVDFQHRVRLVCSSRLDEQLNRLDGAQLVFAGIDDEGLRVLIMDDRVPAHTGVLLTQRNGQYLRATLKLLVERFQEFKSLKPRMESILRRLQALPEDASVLSTGDLVLPEFRVELSMQAGTHPIGSDPDAWTVVLEGGVRVQRRPNQRVFVYDPSSYQATDRGFRGCDVQSLQPGDKLFVMSAELRELVETVLKEAGVEIQHDKSFETALRDYHKKVIKRLSDAFPLGPLSEKVRQLRVQILVNEPSLTAGLPTEQSMRQWVNLGQSAETEFDKLRPQAPLREAHFSAFATCLGFSNIEAAYLWQLVIMPIRNARRIDGRQVSDIYGNMLLQPESALVHSKVTRATLRTLFERARECVISVEAVLTNTGMVVNG